MSYKIPILYYLHFLVVYAVATQSGRFEECNNYWVLSVRVTWITVILTMMFFALRYKITSIEWVTLVTYCVYSYSWFTYFIVKCKYPEGGVTPYLEVVEFLEMLITICVSTVVSLWIFFMFLWGVVHFFGNVVRYNSLRVYERLL